MDETQTKTAPVRANLVVRLKAQDRWAVLATWLIAMTLVAIFAPVVGAALGIPALVLAGGLTLQPCRYQSRRPRRWSPDRSATGALARRPDAA